VPGLFRARIHKDAWLDEGWIASHLVGRRDSSRKELEDEVG
jgi:hypothetical protein